jgi:hypothetical protein
MGRDTLPRTTAHPAFTTGPFSAQSGCGDRVESIVKRVLLIE